MSIYKNDHRSDESNVEVFFCHWGSFQPFSFVVFRKKRKSPIQCLASSSGRWRPGLFWFGRFWIIKSIGERVSACRTYNRLYVITEVVDFHIIKSAHTGRFLIQPYLVSPGGRHVWTDVIITQFGNCPGWSLGFTRRTNHHVPGVEVSDSWFTDPCYNGETRLAHLLSSISRPNFSMLLFAIRLKF